MSKAEILAVLPGLSPDERTEILDQLWRLEEEDALRQGPSTQEKELLDRELSKYQEDPDAVTPWKIAEARLRRKS
ncbi:MAG: hypothetical protein ACREIA_27355 [Opitutaceae bacterium]